MIFRWRINVNVSNNQITKQYRLALREARSVFILITGYYSDPSWYRFRKSLEKAGFLKEGMKSEDVKANVTLASKIRRKCPQTGVDFDTVLKFYIQEESIINQLNGRSLKGGEILELIKRQGIPIPNSTRSMWFQELGGYNLKREYNPEQIKHILFLSAIYKARKQQQQQRQENK